MGLRSKIKRLIERIEDRIDGNEEPETDGERMVFAHYMVLLQQTPISKAPY